MASEMKKVVGNLKAITEKPSGWYVFEIEVEGWNYPLKLETKKEDRIAEARAVGRQTATWQYLESESETINERSGKPFMNRYLEGVTVGVAEAEPTSDEVPVTRAEEVPVTQAASANEVPVTQEVQQGRYTPEEVRAFEDKERRDFRSRAWAHTLTALAHTIKVEEAETEESRQALFERLQTFQRKIYQDICGRFAYPPDDDDIPF